MNDFLARHPGRKITVSGGHQLHVIDEGQGRPVVMLHGNPSWAFYYRNLAEALSPTHRVIIPDHIGMGRSDKPDDSRYTYTLENRVADLENTLDQLGVTSDITLVVHDWGGMIGSTFATRHPGRIARMVVLNTAGFGLPKEKPFPWPLWLSRNTPVSSLFVRGFNGFVKGTAWIGTKQNRMSPDVKQAYLWPYNNWANRRSVHRFVQDIPLTPKDRAWPVLQEVESRLNLLAGKPMFVAFGLKDLVFDKHFLKGWTDRFPLAEVHRYENAGHYILEDVGTDLIPKICDFLART
ncbi:MAG: alpha/beta fold hydrolase [bacterium]